MPACLYKGEVGGLQKAPERRKSSSTPLDFSNAVPSAWNALSQTFTQLTSSHPLCPRSKISFLLKDSTFELTHT